MTHRFIHHNKSNSLLFSRINISLTALINAPCLFSENSVSVHEFMIESSNLLYSGGRNWTYKYQSQPMGFEMPGNDDSWYACLGEQGHSRVCLSLTGFVCVRVGPCYKWWQQWDDVNYRTGFPRPSFGPKLLGGESNVCEALICKSVYLYIVFGKHVGI